MAEGKCANPKLISYQKQAPRQLDKPGLCLLSFESNNNTLIASIEIGSVRRDSRSLMPVKKAKNRLT